MSSDKLFDCTCLLGKGDGRNVLGITMENTRTKYALSYLKMKFHQSGNGFAKFGCSQTGLNILGTILSIILQIIFHSILGIILFRSFHKSIVRRCFALPRVRYNKCKLFQSINGRHETDMWAYRVWFQSIGFLFVEKFKIHRFSNVYR